MPFAHLKHLVLIVLSVSISSVTRAAWITEDSHAPRATFRAIQALDANTVWVAGTGGTCRRTTNGGDTWEVLTVPDAGKLDFRGLFAFDDQTAVLMSSGEASQGLTRIFRTTDAGHTWQVAFQTTESNVFLDGISFWDRTNGLAVGDSIAGKWYLLKTADGGQTWQRITPAGLPAMLPGEGAFAAGNTSMGLAGSSSVWIASGAAERSRIFISSDRGETWQINETPMPSGETAGIYSLRRVDAQRAVAVGGNYKKDHEPSDNVITTSDAGRTWQKAARTDPPGLKETVTALPDGALLAIGPSGTSLSRDFAKTWQPVDTLTLHAASCAAGQCWAVGSRGTIVKWNPSQ